MEGGGRRLDGRVAIVTGAAVGIGQAIALRLAREGARVVVADVKAEEGAASVTSLRDLGAEATFALTDVSDAGQTQAMVERAIGAFGRLDVLVNNAGIPGTSEPADALDPDAWDHILAVNLRGPFLCAKYAIPHLEAAGRGAIVNMASTFGIVGAHASPAYCASKGGVIALTRQLAVDLGPRGIRVNAVCPGFVDNDMDARRTRMTSEAAAANLSAREAAAALQPLGRQGSTDEIAAAVAFLASDDAAFVTGAILPVDGGCTAHFNLGRR